MYPDKEDCLYSKWEMFTEKIQRFYETNLHNDFCKQLFSLAKASTNKDTQDYILTTLLNGVLPPSSWFQSSCGKLRKKATIADSQQSFVLRLTSINDYERKITELISMYYSAGMTIQPFIIVEGIAEGDITGFCIYFDKTLYKFESFLECLDICFKIFHTLCLKYPQACETSWVFLQQFFLEIYTEYDCKPANLTSLLNFMTYN
ncbi:PREDICTED: uncharacterized protein LOC108356328 [Rhagoletis zephyria]|uniref:uncharacterized protein LOC108356328 n=1 Tax=Rhagoletis zephyria TaxID=28612 RepID=UPI0008113F84|nr:PREDICTED: uncharacterized protein LOC108356328 [Rhagoletis zephyria]